MTSEPITPESWYAHVPRALLIACLATAIGLMGWAARRWVEMVEHHVQESVHGYERIKALEVNSDRTLQTMQELTAEVKAMRKDLADQGRKDRRR